MKCKGKKQKFFFLGQRLNLVQKWREIVGQTPENFGVKSCLDIESDAILRIGMA
jgi:hypothetical protein